MAVSTLPIGPASFREGRTDVSYPIEVGTVYVNQRETTPGFTDICITQGDAANRRRIADAIVRENPGAYWHPKLDAAGEIVQYRVRIAHRRSSRSDGRVPATGPKRAEMINNLRPRSLKVSGPSVALLQHEATVNLRLDWDGVASQAASILSCPDCSRKAQDGTPQPPWVGGQYQPGGIVLLAQNPSSVRDLDEHERQLLKQLGEQPSADLFREWSQHRVGHMVSKPWRQWKEGFYRAVGSCLAPEQTAWLNVVPYGTSGNRAPTRRERERCRHEHLVPLLELLEPRGVVARYGAAREALAGVPGPWQVHPMSLPGMGVSHVDATNVHQALHNDLGVPRHPSCAVA